MNSFVGRDRPSGDSTTPRASSGSRRWLPRILDVAFEVCTECGNLHMEGYAAPSNAETCPVCDGDTAAVELGAVIGL